MGEITSLSSEGGLVQASFSAKIDFAFKLTGPIT